jgi:hypothetical protein
MSQNASGSFRLSPEEIAYQQTISFIVFTIGSQYVMIVNCGVGLVLNSICLLVLLSLKIKGDMYKYIILKTIVEMLTLFSSFMSLFTRCQSCITNGNFSAVLIRIIFVEYLNNAAYTCSGFCEIALSYDRLRLFKENSKWMPNIRFRTIACLSLALSALISVPFVFKRRPGREPGTTEASDFSRTAIYSYYVIFINVIQVFLPLIVLIILNSLVAYEFKLYMKRKTRFIGQSRTTVDAQTDEKSKISDANPQALKLQPTSTLNTNNSDAVNIAKNKKKVLSEKEFNFTSMILISSSLFTFTRLVQGIAAIGSIINDSNQVRFSAFFIVLTYLAYQLAFIYFSSSIFIYTMFNKNFRDGFKHFRDKICGLFSKCF